MVDVKKITALVDRVRGYVLKLQKLRSLSETEFFDNSLSVDSAQLNLQYAIEACLDLTNHLIARLGLRAPKDYADSFRVLAESGIVLESFLPTLIKMAKMRNRLVHLYWETDEKEIYQTLQNHLGDFEIFVEAVLNYLEKQNKR